ncbi:MAG: V-type ATPase subunit [Bacteroidota bacterium]
MREHDLAFAVGRIKVLETRLLDAARLERLAEAADLDGARALLGETEYAEALAGGRGPAEIAAAELIRVRRLLLGMLPQARELHFLLWRWDLLNLKSLLRATAAEKADPLNELGMYAPAELVAWLKGEDRPMPALFQEARRAGEEAFRSTGDPQMLDAAIDAVYYRHGARLWRELPGPTLADYWRARIDLTNIRTLVRSKLLGFAPARVRALFLQEGGLAPETLSEVAGRSWEEIGAWLSAGPYAALAQNPAELRSLPALEKRADNLLLSILRAAKGVSLGLEPLLGYYLAKEHETRLVDMVLSAKAAGVPGAEIKERLRVVYA